MLTKYLYLNFLVEKSKHRNISGKGAFFIIQHKYKPLNKIQKRTVIQKNINKRRGLKLDQGPNIRFKDSI